MLVCIAFFVNYTKEMKKLDVNGLFVVFYYWVVFVFVIVIVFVAMVGFGCKFKIEVQFSGRGKDKI